MNSSQFITIGEFVAHDFRTASVFTKYGIDFCCRGHRTVAEVCEKKTINHDDLLEELTAVMITANTNAVDFSSWPLDLLVDYIEKKHHRYVEGKIPVILQYLDKLCQTHGAEHPELLQIQSLFQGCADELTKHLKKEERILFPFINQLEKAVSSTGRLEVPAFDSVEDPIAMMKHEHDNEGERFRKIAILTHNYTPPASACNTYRVTYSMLQDFEQDLHEHIHLENNILFPKAVQLEGKLHQYQC